MQRQTQGPTGLCELFLLTVPIEEVARCQYKTVQIIFPLKFKQFWYHSVQTVFR